MKRTTSIDSFFKAWRSNCLPGLFFVLFMLSCSMVAFSQPTYSRGEQQLAITYEFAMNRAKAALIAEGYVNLNQGGAFISGYKGINTAIIMCNVAPDAKTWVNIVVASNATDSNIPGAERVKLQKRMDQNLSGSSLVGEWFLKCCNDELQWTLHIKNQNGSDFSGSFNDVNGGGNITNGKINGNNIEFVRSGNWGSQKWTAQLTTVGGQQRMVNGVWTGDYLDSYKGKNNWHAEMDQNLSGSNLVGKWFLKCCNDELQWTLHIKNQNGSDFSGSLNDVNGGGNITNGKINGNIIEFVRSGNWGSQKWTAQLTTVGGQQRMVNGVWTGDYLDAYKGKNNWHAEMDQNLSGSNLVGEWFLKCCNDELQWTLYIKNQNGSEFSGSFNDVNGGGNITNGKINGNNIEFVRSGYWGSQKWTAQLTTVGGQQRIVNGVWTGDYLDAYKGKNNWHAEKK